MNKFIKTFSTLSFCVSVALALTACGGADQDEGARSTFQQKFSGVVIDGRVARATVFIDTNNNGTRDPWEPFAFTDNEGYYSFNPNTGTDYCASTASAQEAQYCLIAGTAYANVVIRMDGGYDVLTGEPLLGQMSRRINASTIDDTPSVISPITSLLTNVESTTDQSSLLTSLGLEETDIDVNYLDSDGAGTINTNLLNTALKIHKTVAVLSDRLTDTYTLIGDEIGTPNDASSSVYPKLAEQIISSGNTLDQALSDSTSLASILDGAEDQLREVYNRRELTLPADMGTTSSPGAFERVINVASELAAVVNTLIDANNPMTLADATGSARALESLVIKTVNEGAINDTTIENAITFLDDDGTDAGKSALLDDLVKSLSEDGADLTGLSTNDFTGLSNTAAINLASSLGVDVSAFTPVAGLSLKISDLDLGSAPSDLKDTEVEFYFAGSDGDVEGSFKACVKVIDGASSDGSLGDGNTSGELIDGFWSLLGATQGDLKSHSLLITLTFLNNTYQAIMKPAGKETIDAVEYEKVRFDFGGEFEAFHSLDGFSTTVTSMPTSNQECAQRLPSRVGL